MSRRRYRIRRALAIEAALFLYKCIFTTRGRVTHTHTTFKISSTPTRTLFSANHKPTHAHTPILRTFSSTFSAFKSGRSLSLSFVDRHIRSPTWWVINDGRRGNERAKKTEQFRSSAILSATIFRVPLSPTRYSSI